MPENERRQQLLDEISREERAYQERVGPLRRELAEIESLTRALVQQPDRDLTQIPRHLWRR